ncbi:SHOCT domain-containing protein [Lactococcus kimchii]|uniref:SHOCT domain-containing protein n=1 Tax=Lactococcus sp. S-13 TaxID=2507158 RepID=UPI0016816A43|nr:SHOCT domain-containing protein [Lactococcus sp. S-13]
MNDRNELLYELSISTTKQLLENQLISKKEYRQIKEFLIQKYQPIIPQLLR